MSFILDALRKSEIERQRQSGPGMAEFPIAREDRRLPVALIAIGVLLALNVAVVLFFMLRDANAPAASATQVALAAPASTRAPPPVAARAAVPAPVLASEPGAMSPLEAAAAGADGYDERDAGIYGDAPTLPPGAPDPTLLPESSTATPNVTYSEAPPGEDAASVQAATGLPELAVDLHIFADEPAKRAVFINGRRYVRGDQIAEGPVVEEITPDGALLSYRGRRFLLPRL